MSAPPSPTLSDTALLESLEDDPAFNLEANREQRLEAIQAEARQLREIRETKFGRVVTFGEEKGLIERMSKEKWCIVHFFMPDFRRCQIMDQKLDELAPKHTHTLFLRTSVSNAPFLVSKFGVQVLPCVMSFVDGRCVDRLVGFEELGNNDKFTSAALEFRLQQSGVLPIGPITLSSTFDIPQSTRHASDSDSDEDEEQQRRRKNGQSSRRGKVGVRNGFALDNGDDYE